jgi:hypothetical protein
MTTPTKTKNTKAKKPVQKQTAYIGLGQILEQHENSFITIEEAINDHAVNIDELNENIYLHNGEILELKNFIEHSINCIFWMTAIGIAVAITFSGVAIFR